MIRCRGSCGGGRDGVVERMAFLVSPKGVQSEAEYNPAGELAAGLGAGGGVAGAVGRGRCWSWARGVGEWVG